MKSLRWITHEMATVLAVTLYFGACFLVVELLKQLELQSYEIGMGSLSLALVLALVTAKVAVVLDKLPLGHRIGLIEVVLRTGVYLMAAFGLMLVEKALSMRDAAGGFMPALGQILDHPDMPRIWATLVCIGFAFTGYKLCIGVDAL